MSLLKTNNANPIPVLVYHQIASAPPRGSPFRSLYVSPETFARQMRFLKWLGFTGLSMGNLQPYLRGERTGKVLGITLDDGYLNNLTEALPVLQRHGFSATCYAVSGLSGKTNLWDEKIGIPQTPLMSDDQMRQWVAGGQEIGAHTRSHVNLLKTDDATCLAEIMQSKSDLESALQRQIDNFCYPFGSYEPKHVAMASAQGFVTATTTRRSRCRSGMSMMEIPRVHVLRSTTLPLLWLKVASAYEDIRF